MTKTYLKFITELKQQIVTSRYIAARLANREQLQLYYKTGKMLSEKMDKQKWGSKVIQQISGDLQSQLPGLRGFSYRNLMNMRQFYEFYREWPILQTPSAEFKKIGSRGPLIGQTLSAQLERLYSLSFSHHLLLINKCYSKEAREYYMKEAVVQFWSLAILEHQIDSGYYERKGKLPNNFAGALPKILKPEALQIFKDEYLMDFIGVSGSSDEKELEKGIVTNIRNFILRMGKGFSFIGNQFRIELEGEEFFIDLLFYNRHLQSLVAFELKQTQFKPAYAGQLNFYLNVLDEKYKLPHENPSIGIVLCKEKNNTIVEFSVKSIDKAMGVATYKTSKVIPEEMKGILPDAEALRGLM